MKNPALVLALLLSVTISALAQSNQSRIVDLDGNGVTGVVVECKATCSQTAGPIATSMTSTVTDENGRFIWSVPGPPGLGSYCALTTKYAYTLKKSGYIFTRATFSYMPNAPFGLQGHDERLPLIQAATLPPWANVSAANFFDSQVITTNMIIAGFGSDLAERTESAVLPLPSSLAGRRVLIKDFAGTEKAAKLLFVSPGQINYIVPDGLSEGPAIIRLVDEDNNLIKTGLADVRNISHGVFTANADGQGVPAAVITRVRPGNVQTYEPVAQFDPIQNMFVPLEIDLGPETEFIVLSLFGTGWRQVSSISDIKVYTSKDGYIVEFCPVEYVGKQPTIEGLDQINIRLPRGLIGKGDVRLHFGIRDIYTNEVNLKFK